MVPPVEGVTLKRGFVEGWPECHRVYWSMCILKWFCGLPKWIFCELCLPPTGAPGGRLYSETRRRRGMARMRSCSPNPNTFLSGGLALQKVFYASYAFHQPVPLVEGITLKRGFVESWLVCHRVLLIHTHLLIECVAFRECIFFVLCLPPTGARSGRRKSETWLRRRLSRVP